MLIQTLRSAYKFCCFDNNSLFSVILAPKGECFCKFFSKIHYPFFLFCFYRKKSYYLFFFSVYYIPLNNKKSHSPIRRMGHF